MTKVYMIDDNALKQGAFQAILVRANELSKERGRGIQFSCGYSDDEARLIGTNASTDVILESLRKDGIFLVDIILQKPGTEETPPFSSHFPSAARNCSGFKSVIAQVDSCDNLPPKLRPAAIIIKYLQAAGKPFLLASTDSTGADLQALRQNLGDLGRDEERDFPLDVTTNYGVASVARWAEKLLSLIDPLTMVKERTKDWFSLNPLSGWTTYDANGLPHELTLHAAEDHQGHEQSIRKILPTLPQDVQWWAAKSNVRAMHEATKTFCGSHAEWMGASPDRPLSLAGIYWVFLMAVQAHAPASVSSCLVKDWSSFFSPSRDITANHALTFLRRQTPKSAEHAVRSLYEFFASIVTNKRDGTFAIAEVVWPRQGLPHLEFQLNWNPDDVAAFEGAVSDRIADAIEPGNGLRSLPREKASGAYLRFLVAAQATRDGFGALGAVRLVTNTSGSQVGTIVFEGRDPNA